MKCRHLDGLKIIATPVARPGDYRCDVEATWTAIYCVGYNAGRWVELPLCARHAAGWKKKYPNDNIGRISKHWVALAGTALMACTAPQPPTYALIGDAYLANLHVDIPSVYLVTHVGPVGQLATFALDADVVLVASGWDALDAGAAPEDVAAQVTSQVAQMTAQRVIVGNVPDASAFNVSLFVDLTDVAEFVDTSSSLTHPRDFTDGRPNESGLAKMAARWRIAVGVDRE